MSKGITEVYRGRLVLVANGEEDDILGLCPEDADGPHGSPVVLVEEIQSDICCYGAYLSVRYFITDAYVAKDELDEQLVRMALGYGDAEYAMHYSDITGYLFTTEELMVGGHDLVDELKYNIGKFLHMEITYNKGQNDAL